MQIEYEAAAKILATEAPNCVIANVKLGDDTTLASKYQVTGYPEILLFTRNGKHRYTYPKRKEARLIVGFVTQQTVNKSFHANCTIFDQKFADFRYRLVVHFGATHDQ